MGVAELSGSLAADLDETYLEHRLFPTPIACVAQEKHQMPSLEFLYQEMKKKGVTL
jgi:hypothetical protein